VPDLLAACDLFVLPSRQEGLGVAALEAMVLGRPIVATDVGGLAEAVRHECTGLLVPPDDPVALKDAIARLLGDARLRARFATAGPRRVDEDFRVDRMIDSYERLSFEVLEETRRL
jgi:glycosyltransferase involved in cell wall biosynthesis